MDLYFSPLACSMATRIALYEAGETARYLEVDPKTKVVQNDGSDFRRSCNMSPIAFRRRVSARVPPSNAAGCINGFASSGLNCTRACSFRCSTGRPCPR